MPNNELTRSDNTKLGDWRRWAVLLTLHGLNVTQIGATRLIANRTNTNGWSVWPEDQREWTAACRRTLQSLEARHLVQRNQYLNTEITWSLTAVGRALVETHLIGNPNITREKFEAAR